jgi:serine protease inhibitor
MRKDGRIEMMRPDPDTLRLVQANNRFGLDLFTVLAVQQPEKNVFIAPYSLAAVLAMTYNGAGGGTEEAMAEVLHLDEMQDLAEVNKAHAQLREQLQDLDPQVQLAIANSLWARAGITFKAGFVRQNQSFYEAKIAVMDPDEKTAVETINDWVRGATGDKIDELVTSIHPLTILFLINATYFKGDWVQPFDPARTRPGDFTSLDGSKQRLPMMSRRGKIPYWRGPSFQAVKLAYGTGRINAYVVLPDRDVGLPALQEELAAWDWSTLRYRFRLTEGKLVLPRFKVEYDQVLNDALKTLGMAAAFSSGSADFSNMCPIPPLPAVYIAKVQHKTFLEVNEEGTEAAAASLVEMRVRGMRIEPEPFQMIVDRAFVFAIVDDRTGSLLFLGSIVDPPEGDGPVGS